MEIQIPTSEDAEELVQLHKMLASQHPFVPNETRDEDTRLDWMGYYLKSQNDWQHIYIVRKDEHIIANLWIMRENNEARAHTAYIGIAVLKNHCTQGIGTALMQKAEEWAHNKSCRKMTVKVVSKDIPAVSFFLKNDFLFEGVKRESYYWNEKYYDEYIMEKSILPKAIVK